MLSCKFFLSQENLFRKKNNWKYMDLQIKNFHLQHSVAQIEKLAAILIICREQYHRSNSINAIRDKLYSQK